MYCSIYWNVNILLLEMKYTEMQVTFSKLVYGFLVWYYMRQLGQLIFLTLNILATSLKPDPSSSPFVHNTNVHPWWLWQKAIKCLCVPESLKGLLLGLCIWYSCQVVFMATADLAVVLVGLFFFFLTEPKRKLSWTFSAPEPLERLMLHEFWSVSVLHKTMIGIYW